VEGRSCDVIKNIFSELSGRTEKIHKNIRLADVPEKKKIRTGNIQATRLKKSNVDARVCRYLFTAKLLYMFRASIAPIIRSI